MTDPDLAPDEGDEVAAAMAGAPLDAPDPAGGSDAAGSGAAGAELSVESLLDDVERLTAELAENRTDTLRVRADYENYKKQLAKRQADELAQASARLVEDLLPVLDACDGAVHHGAVEVEPIFAALLGVLEKGGLERIDPSGEPFDPNRHEAVMHEPAEDGDTETVVADVMRRGYALKGRVLRPAMVKVRG